MSLRDRIKAFLNPPWSADDARGYNLEDPNTPLFPAFGGVKLRSGISVSEQSAVRSATVLACVRVLAETLASLPLLTYRRLAEGGKERAKEHPLYELLHTRPNPYMTSFTWRETLMAHLLLWGNHFSEIQFDGYGLPAALWPLDPASTSKAIDSTGIPYVRTVIRGEGMILPIERVLHIPGLGFDGLSGKSVVGWGAETIGYSMAIEQYAATFYSNGSNPNGVLETDKVLKPDTSKRLAASWAEAHQGLDNAHRVAVLEDGVKWKATTIAPHDAQTLELLKYSAIQICKLFRVPPHLAMELDRATFSNIEEQSIEFVVYALRPWAVRIEQCLNHSLFLPAERPEYFTEFLLDGLLRGDMLARAQALHIMRQDGILSGDEWREIENMNPQPDGIGKKFLANGNMIDLAKPANTTQNRGADLEPVIADAAARFYERARRDLPKLATETLAADFRGASERLIEQHAAAIFSPILRAMTGCSHLDGLGEYLLRALEPILEARGRDLKETVCLRFDRLSKDDFARELTRYLLAAHAGGEDET